MRNLIQVKNLTKIYITGEVKTLAVNKVSFLVRKGEFIAIMGPSGSGKSTLMQMLGFLDRPTKGSYYFKGKNIKKFDDNKLAHIRNTEVGFIFQTFNLLPRTSVFENVELPLLYNRDKENKKNIKEKVQKALESVSMTHRIGYSSNQLSGGEKQRVAIARALVNNPDLIFADEPTGNLDSKSGLQVMKILQNLNNKGKTIILVTHETQTANHAKRMLKMKDGELIDDDHIENRTHADYLNLLK
jgi:putative ABC transport system ATP-binding protein